MFGFSKPSIQRRLRYAMMTTAEIGLLVTLLFYSFNDYYKSRHALIQHLEDITRIVNVHATHALEANRAQDATRALSLLAPIDTVHEAYIVNSRGELFSRYTRSSYVSKSIPLVNEMTTVFKGDWLKVSAPVRNNKGLLIGTIMLKADMTPLYKQIKLNILVALMITVLAIIFAYIAAFRLQRKITQPIIRLAGHMKQVTVSQIYESNLISENDDEIGELYDQFNEMLEQVHQRDKELSQHKNELEETVKLRTEALNIANSSLKNAIREATEAKESALDAAKAKSAFLANMSHEIRTPMNGVLGMLEMMKDTELDNIQRDYLETAYGSADSLLQIINDILDFSKIEAGKLELETVDTSPNAIIEDIAALLASKTREKNIELGCYADVKLPACIKADPVRLRQILTNLLGNAVKFTTEGEVVIRALSQPGQLDTAKKNTHCCIRFEVEDTGIGIAPEVIPNLFQPFTQADSSTTRKFGGTGLGLTISRQLVTLMDGELKVRSEEGKGSCFYFDVEFEISDSLPSNHKINREQQSSLKGMYALIVDDNSTNREILRHYLTAWKMDYVEADDGNRALEKIRDAQTAGRPFEVAYLDMQMPGMDGIELSRTMADDSDLAMVKRIMLTSSGPMTDQERQDACLHAALAKPYRQSQLLDATLDVLTLKSDRKNTKAASEEKADDSNFINSKLLLVEDNAVNQKVALAMLGKLKLTADIANNGREAVEAVEKQDYDLVLMDCQMPEMSGYEATEAIRKKETEENTSHLTIIAMTANAMEGDREKCLESGMDDYISKPIKLDILKKTLSQWLETENTPTSASPVTSEEKNTADKSPPLVNDSVWKTLQQKNTALKKQVQAHMDNADTWIHEILSALRHKKTDTLLPVLSEFKSSCDTLGAEQLASLLARLETYGKQHQYDKAISHMPSLTTLHHETNKCLQKLIQT